MAVPVSRTIKNRISVKGRANQRAFDVQKTAIQLLKGDALLLRLRIAELEANRLATNGVTILINEPPTR